MAGVSPSAKTFTPKQGQYLAFIQLYTPLHRRTPAESDMQEYFRVSQPAIGSPNGALARASRPHQKAAQDTPQHRDPR
jgi:hypothetical protein